MSIERDWEAAARKRLERLVTGVAERLRKLADEIETEGRYNLQAVVDRPGRSYVPVAAAVVHSVTWGVANLNLGTVLDAANDAQSARQEAWSKAAELVPVDRRPELLDSLREVVKGWADGAHANDGARNPKPAEDQEFVLSDIMRMIDDVAREAGLEVKR
jgi:hypothetical protein